MVSSDFNACLLKSGDLFVWGPTPLGQFNQPRLLSEIINAGKESVKINVKKISIGTSFGLMQDHEGQCFQLGNLFHENSKHYDSTASALSHLLL